ncbi:hypothetical protein BHD05_10950 [Marisediminicola antarctica]|uniref:Aminoglycoside phosphotransferase domain-containing protein n=1 Tax=Marisediminicola antarctica TaxID=674079 RepID=A0A7L5APD2_9MICO|nr:hypothetical protein BHD05_10950 [Marisediminicola antarctica]
MLEWVAASVGATSASWSRSLLGGMHAVTDVVRTSDRQDLVLRRFPAGDDAVHREVRVLSAIDGLDGLAPLLIAADPDGATGTPTILTTLLAGSAFITPHDPVDFARQLGRTLASIHARAPGPGLSDVITSPRAAAQFGACPEQLLAEPHVLTHFDFWSGNTVWRDGRLTGVVDWCGAGTAPPGLDVSWARLDLILLYDRVVADAFTRAYESAVGVQVPDIDLWDLYAASNARPNVESWAPGYQGLGRGDLGPASLRQRLTEWSRIAGGNEH